MHEHADLQRSERSQAMHVRQRHTERIHRGANQRRNEHVARVDRQHRREHEHYHTGPGDHRLERLNTRQSPVHHERDGEARENEVAKPEIQIELRAFPCVPDEQPQRKRRRGRDDGDDIRFAKPRIRSRRMECCKRRVPQDIRNYPESERHHRHQGESA